MGDSAISATIMGQGGVTGHWTTELGDGSPEENDPFP